MSATLLEQEKFFPKYNIDKDEFEKTGLEWESLGLIYLDHLRNTQNLLAVANYITESLRQVSEVHSLRFRVKDAEHLVEKIIRKKIEDKDLEINIENYKTLITDLIGVRALHLFKEDWNNIHDFIVEQWELNEKPTANVRKGDPEEYNQQFTDKGCVIKEHPRGYRSVHYLIKSKPTKEILIAELQIRTIFEEGWSEIDHKIRYPYDLGNLILKQVSAIHNRLAGSADEIGSFIQILKKEFQEIEERQLATDEERNTALEELNQTIKALKITNKEKDELKEKLDSLSPKTPNIKIDEKVVISFFDRMMTNIRAGHARESTAGILDRSLIPVASVITPETKISTLPANRRRRGRAKTAKKSDKKETETKN